MTPEKQLLSLQEEAKTNQQTLLVIFSGDDCKWCKQLKVLTTSSLELAEYARLNKIHIAWLTLLPKNEEIADARTHSKQGLRTEYKIASIPTAALFNAEGALLGTTEYLDEVDTKGTQAYVDWISPLLFPRRKRA